MTAWAAEKVLNDILTAEGERLMLATIRCHSVVFFETTSGFTSWDHKILKTLNVVSKFDNDSLLELKKRQTESERAIGSNKDSQKVSWLTDVDLRR